MDDLAVLSTVIAAGFAVVLGFTVANAHKEVNIALIATTNDLEVNNCFITKERPEWDGSVIGWGEITTSVPAFVLTADNREELAAKAKIVGIENLEECFPT
jgi:hypothetical protein